MSAYLKPRSLVLARTLWFFALYVAADAIRWMGAMLTAAKARLAAEWRHAAIRAKAPRQAP